MNIFLWILQIFLALHTATGAIWKFSNSEQTIPALQTIPHPVWIGLGIIEIICSIFLILPIFSKSLRVLAPIAAIFIALEMLFFCAVQLYSGNYEYGQTIYWLIVAIIANFIAYKRMRVSPKIS